MTKTRRTVLVTGASRGIGLALAENLVARGDRVVAVVRQSSNTAALQRMADSDASDLQIYRTDLTSESALETLAESIQGRIDSLDVLINNAGIMLEGESIATVRADDLVEHYLINAVSPVIVTKAMLPLLRSADAATVVNISSSFASLELKNSRMPSRYSYSMSKAAINMFSKTLALELAEEGIAVLPIHPGWTRTLIGGPDAQLSPEESAAGVLETLDGMTIEQSGEFLTWTAKNLPW